MNVKEILMEKYGLEIPECPKPVALYRPCARVGNLLYLSGQTASKDGKQAMQGIVGQDLTAEEAKVSARLAALNLIAALNASLEGDFSKVKQVVQILGFVRCTPEFADQPFVVNGASELFFECFGESGIASRAALGTNALPGGASVEVLAVVELVEGA